VVGRRQSLPGGRVESGETPGRGRRDVVGGSECRKGAAEIAPVSTVDDTGREVGPVEDDLGLDQEIAVRRYIPAGPEICVVDSLRLRAD
jgi:hypothetical protein